MDEPLEQLLVARLALQNVVVTGLRTTSTKPKGYLRIKHLLFHQLNNPSQYYCERLTFFVCTAKTVSVSSSNRSYNEFTYCIATIWV